MSKSQNIEASYKSQLDQAKDKIAREWAGLRVLLNCMDKGVTGMTAEEHLRMASRIQLSTRNIGSLLDGLSTATRAHEALAVVADLQSEVGTEHVGIDQLQVEQFAENVARGAGYRDVVRFPTGCFASSQQAVDFFEAFGHDRQQVREMIADSKIRIGEPDLEEGQKALLDRESGRYFIEQPRN